MKRTVKAGWLSVLLLIVITGISCSRTELHIPEESAIFGLATPIDLEFEDTEVLLQDYFIDPSVVDSVQVPAGLSADLISDSAKVLISGDMNAPMGIMKIFAGNAAYSFLLKRSEKQMITFTFDPGEEEYEQVKMKGEMNSWNPNNTELEFKDGVWTTEMLISEGIYQYLFVADGEEKQDPSNEETVSNGMGGFNSLLRVGDTDVRGPSLYTETFRGDLVSLRSASATDYVVFWNNFELPLNRSGNWVSFVIPEAAKSLERSYIRAWAHDGNKISNDVLIPIQKGRVIDETADLGRQDWHNWNMYFVLIDRFKDGNPANTRKLNNPEVDPRVDYYGGDLAGITQKIKDGYFEEMGINSLWLSPIAQNPEAPYGYWDQGGPETKFSGYHGYWPISSSKIDDRFGTAEEFHELLSTAHENGISVILDYVANHVHEEHPVYQQHKDWATNLYLPDGSMNTQLWDQQRLTTWFDTFMPSLDFSRPEVVETMTDSALFWLQNYELDGFRHDATKHIQLEFWRVLTRKIKDSISIPENKRLYQIGETYGSRELIASYINTGMLDAQFDFNMYDAGLKTFGRGESFTGLQDQLNESFKYFGYHNLMGYISGNHDKPRFISLTSGEVKWDEDGKIAGWTRNIERPQEFAYNRLLMFHAFNQTIPGIPVTYMGDEYGQPGANDPDNRRWMVFDEEQLTAEELRTRNIFRTLTGLRKDRIEFTYGDFEFHQATDHTLAYSRAYFEDLSYVVFNKSDQEQTISLALRDGYDASELKGVFGSEVLLSGNNFTVTLPPNSFEIIN